MQQRLQDPCYSYISDADKAFIAAFDQAIGTIGYLSHGEIGPGFCWGRAMVIYRKGGVKTGQVAARIYIRDDNIALRLFLNNIDRHRDYLEHAPKYIQAPFVGDQGTCQHCHNERDGTCRFRKTYTLQERRIEKCNGLVFTYERPVLDQLPDFMALLREFYGPKRQRN